jgi:hypothetical protein
MKYGMEIDGKHSYKLRIKDCFAVTNMATVQNSEVMSNIFNIESIFE